MTNANRYRPWIHAEHAQRLADVVLVDREIPPGKAGNRVSFGVLHRDRNYDFVHLRTNHRVHGANALFRRRILRVRRWCGRRRWLARRRRRGLLGLAGVGRRSVGAGRRLSGAHSRRDGPLNTRQRPRGSLRGGCVGHGSLLLGQNSCSQSDKRCQRDGPSLNVHSLFFLPQNLPAHASKRV